MTIWFALVLVTLCAVLWDVGIVLQKLAVADMPALGVGRGIGRSLRAVLRSGRWMGGLAASAAGWGFFAFALSFTPVSIARAIQGSGFVVLAVFSVLFLRHRLKAGEWIGVALVTLGIAALGVAEGAGTAAAAPLSVLRLLPVAAAALAVCALAWLLPRMTGGKIRSVTAFSVMAGVLLGVGDVATRALILVLERDGGLVAGVVVAVGLV
ncbi:MAG TPA: EamA family transporter, partial [Spirochaetia bacterium]